MPRQKTVADRINGTDPLWTEQRTKLYRKHELLYASILIAGQTDYLERQLRLVEAQLLKTGHNQSFVNSLRDDVRKMLRRLDIK